MVVLRGKKAVAKISAVTLGILAVLVLVYFVSISGLVGADDVQLPQEGTCPFVQGQGYDYVVDFNPQTKIVSTEPFDDYNIHTGNKSVDLPAGTYEVYLYSWDNDRAKDGTQDNEQYKVLFFDSAGNNIANSSNSTDLADTGVFVEWQGLVDSGLVLSNDVTKVQGFHSAYYDDSTPNSLYAECAAFNLVEEEPECTVDEDCTQEGLCEVASCEDNQCVYDFEDNEGPVTSDLTVSKISGTCQVNITALETDQCSDIAAAEYFIGYCGSSDNGTLNPADGLYDSLIEQIQGHAGVFDGSVDVYVRGQDSQGNWGECKHVTFASDCLPPDYPTCAIGNTNKNNESEPGIIINDECNPYEKLVCGDDPKIEANICDDQSKIQLSEYFLDDMPLTNWEGIYMDPTDGLWKDEFCEDVEATVDLSELSEGTHYVQLHGKDTQENWGKLPDSPKVSFIKDTTAPKTLKTIDFADERAVECGFEEANGNDLTDGCYYVKPGTKITLDARDFNPDDSTDDIGLGDGYNNLEGEYAGDVVINWNVYYSEDCTADQPVWELSQSGTSGVDEDVEITLNEDSCHLIEYWAVDGICGNTEDKHYELDIVDSKAPEITKEVSDPKVAGDANPIHYYITSDTDISLSCEDVDPHPVGGEVLNWEMYYNGESNDCDLTDEQWGEPIESGSEKDGNVVISELSDSCHKLVYSCEDALGNKGETQIEIDAVDNQAPEIEKEIIGPQWGICPPENTYGIESDFIQNEEGQCFLDGITDISVTVTDPNPHPVDDVTCDWDYVVVDKELDGEGVTGIKDSQFIVHFPEESHHVLYINCSDALGNEVRDVEHFYVDKTPPLTSKAYRGNYVLNYDEIVSAADRILELQNSDGGWDWTITNDTVPGESTAGNLFGVTAFILLDAYKMTGDMDYLYGAMEVGDVLLAKTPGKTGLNRFYSQDIEFLAELGQVSGDIDYTNKAKEVMDYFMNSDNRYCATDGCTASEINSKYQSFYPTGSGNEGITEWQLASWVRAAQLTGNNAWANDLINEMELSMTSYFDIYDTGMDTYVLGLSGLLDVTGNETVKQELLNSQNSEGGWDEGIQSTAYALMALEKVGELSAASDAANYLANNFGYDSINGWLESNDKEYSEATSEAGQALFTVYSRWINDETSILLEATDSIGPHNTGVVETNYRVTLLENDEACRSQTICQNAEGSGEFQEYEGAFTIDDESCHLIEYYSVDNVGKTETVKKQCAFVDLTAPETYKTIDSPSLLCEDGVGKCGPETEWDAYYVNSSTNITLSCEDQLPHPVGNEELCFKVSWHGTEYGGEWGYITQNYGKMNDEGYVCVDVNDNKEYNFNFLEDSLHNLEWYCEDALGNTGDLNVEYDNVDNQPPMIFFVNPTPDFASDVEMCIQSVVVQAGDLKSGLNESSLYAELINESGDVVRSVPLHKQEYGQTTTYEAMMDKELPSGWYDLVVYASDNLGNTGEISREEYLSESIVVQYVDSENCNVDAENGGECDLEFNLCIRDGNTVRFGLNKFKEVVTPGMMNATISNDGLESVVGLWEPLFGVDEEECEYNNENSLALFGYSSYSWNDEYELCWFLSDAEELPLSCEDINGQAQFTLHLNLSSNVTQYLGPGIHNLDYIIETSTTDLLCNDVESHASVQQECVDINTASLSDLQLLEGIGDTLAQSIIDYRESEGPFGSIDDLDNVPGIGGTKVSDIKEQGLVCEIVA